MDGGEIGSPRRREIVLQGRGTGVMSALDFGPADRPIDIVFLHANGFNANTYRSILTPLAGELRILAADQRGHGETSLAAEIEGRSDWYDLRDDLIALLRALELKRVVLSGHSMGATASLLAAAVEDDLARRLVLFEPVIMPLGVQRRDPAEMLASPLVQSTLRRRTVFPSRAEALEALRGRGAFKTWPEESLADYVAGAFRDRPDGDVELACDPRWEASSFTGQGHDTWGAFAATTCPIQIFQAEFNSTGTLAEGLAQLNASDRVHLETIPGTTHFLPLERPELVRTALREAARS